jgi:L-lactate dehydrogenase complex protein LldE
MVRHSYPELFMDDLSLARRAQELSKKTFELSDFLVNVLNCDDVGSRFEGRVTYQDACHLLRELGISEEPRRLIKNVRGLQLVETKHSQVCCGFGGTFSVKYPEISSAMLEEKLQEIESSKVEAVVASDASCLMQIAGGLRRRKLPCRTMHLAELLAQE